MHLSGQASPSPSESKKLSATQQMFIALAVGLAAGAVVHAVDPSLSAVIKPFSDIFLRMIKMILGPLIFATLVVGVAGVEHPKDFGRMTFRAIVYFEVVTTAALIIGLIAAHVAHPGVGVVLPPVVSTEVPKVQPKSWQEVILHMIPSSFFQALAENDVLQVVVFSMFFAVALNRMGEKGKPLLNLIELTAQTMFKLTHIVMGYAPIGVAAAMAYVVGHAGFGVLKNLGALVLTLYVALAIVVVFVLLPGAVMFRIPIKKFFSAVKEPVLIAFSTSSGEAALPRAMEVMEEFGVPRRVVSFVLPLGYSFNLVGSTMYLTLGSLFVAQAAGVHLSVGQQITMVLTLMLTSKGVAGVSRASLVVIAATLASYNLPLEGITLILGVDAVMDMARSLVNMLGNCLATVIVSKWEGNFNEGLATAPVGATAENAA